MTWIDRSIRREDSKERRNAFHETSMVAARKITTTDAPRKDRIAAKEGWALGEEIDEMPFIMAG